MEANNIVVQAARLHIVCAGKFPTPSNSDIEEDLPITVVAKEGSASGTMERDRLDRERQISS